MTMTDFITDPDCPLALVGASGAVLHTTGNLDMARAIARKMVRGDWEGIRRQCEVIIHRHNGGDGWQAGTEIVERVTA